MVRGRERTTSLPVVRGLYVLRYESAGSLDEPPQMFVAPAPDCMHAIRFVSVPGRDDNVLSAPGSNLVIVAYDRGELRVTARAGSAGGSLEANLRMEPLGQSEVFESAPREDAREFFRDEPRAAPVERPVSDVRSDSDMSILTHVAGRGDVAAGAGVWIGGPNGQAVIEGLEVRGALFDQQVELSYQVLMRGAGGAWTSWFRAGEFAGSRGRSLPLVGVRFRLTGTDAAASRVGAEAVFEGSPAIRRSGSQVELMGTSGSESLVGLRLSVSVDRQLRLQESAPDAQRNKVRVFRAARS